MKGKKLIFAFVLALIVCLVLVPCAYAEEDGTECATYDVVPDQGDNNGDTQKGTDSTEFETKSVTVEKDASQETINAALNEGLANTADGGTFTFTQDSTTANLEYDGNNTITIDLGGKVLNSSDKTTTDDVITYGTALTVNSGAVTIKNGKINGNVIANGSATITLFDVILNGNLTVQGTGEATAKGNVTENSTVNGTVYGYNNAEIYVGSSATITNLRLQGVYNSINGKTTATMDGKVTGWAVSYTNSELTLNGDVGNFVQVWGNMGTGTGKAKATINGNVGGNVYVYTDAEATITSTSTVTGYVQVWGNIGTDMTGHAVANVSGTVRNNVYVYNNAEFVLNSDGKIYGQLVLSGTNGSAKATVNGYVEQTGEYCAVYTESNCEFTLGKTGKIYGFVFFRGYYSSDSYTGDTKAYIYGQIVNPCYSFINSNGEESGYATITTNGLDRSNTTIYIYDGAYVGYDKTKDFIPFGVYLPSCNLVVEGGTIEGKTGVYCKGGSVNISGGVITAVGEKGQADLNYNNGASSTGAALTVEAAQTETSGYGEITGIKISGGTLTSLNNSPITVEYREGSLQKDLGNFVYGVTMNNTVEEECIAENATVLTITGKVAVGTSSYPAAIKALISEASSNGNVITVAMAAENANLSAPSGTTFINLSGVTIYVNGVEVAIGATYTVPAVVEEVVVEAVEEAVSTTVEAVIEGNSTVSLAANEEVVIKLNFTANDASGESVEVISVTVNGVEVEFTVAEDGSIVLSPEVLAALGPGTHVIYIRTSEGLVKVTITITE